MEHMTNELIDSTFAEYKIGKTIEGVIIKIKENGFLVNIGGKRDAFIYNEDIKDKNKYKIGDSIKGIIIDKKDENGLVKISNIDYEANVESKKIAKELKVGSKIKVKINQIVDGGLIGSIADYNVFIPNSHIDFAHKKNLKLLLNSEMCVYIIQADLRNKKIVCSIKQVEDEIREQNENEFWTNIKPNMIVKGKISKFTDYGAFIDINNSGIHGLLHNSNVGFFGENANSVFEKEIEYSFIVLNIDYDNKKIELGYKQLQDDPRKELYKKYTIGQELEGEIIKIFSFGAVVKIEEKVNGFLHISECEYGLNDMREAYKLGDKIECKIKDINMEDFKISLSRAFKYDYEVQ